MPLFQGMVHAWTSPKVLIYFFIYLREIKWGHDFCFAVSLLTRRFQDFGSHHWAAE